MVPSNVIGPGFGERMTDACSVTFLGWALVIGGAALAILGGLLLGWAVPIALLPGVALALIGLTGAG